MTTEILDEYAQLRPWMDPAVAARARDVAQQHRLTGEDQDAVVEATVLEAAAAARRAGHQPATGDGRPALRQRTQDTDTDAVGEVAWLTRVAQALPHGGAVPPASTGDPDALLPRGETTI